MSSSVSVSISFDRRLYSCNKHKNFHKISLKSLRFYIRAIKSTTKNSSGPWSMVICPALWAFAARAAGRGGACRCSRARPGTWRLTSRWAFAAPNTARRAALSTASQRLNQNHQAARVFAPWSIIKRRLERSGPSIGAANYRGVRGWPLQMPPIFKCQQKVNSKFEVNVSHRNCASCRFLIYEMLVIQTT